VILLLACAPAPPLPEHTMAMGGDVIVGGRMNLYTDTPEKRAKMLAEVAEPLRRADLAWANLESVIASGGTWANRAEQRPHLYRSPPEALEVLAAAGIDAVAVGNNHSGDYGPVALTEMLDRLRMAGLDYMGGGRDDVDARTPAYFTVGDTVVALVGAELTLAEIYAATPDTPGILWLPGMKAKKADVVVETLLGVAEQARAHAHVVVLTPHWGENFVQAPSAETRALAKRLLEGGYDAIAAHSAHLPQGVELIGGKPVLYDAGNLVGGWLPNAEGPYALLYELAFTRAGVTEVRARPLRVDPDRVKWAKGAEGAAVLRYWADSSSAMGVTAELQDGLGTIRCDPGGVEGPEGTPTPPSRPVPTEARVAPNDVLADTALPAWATPTDVRWPGGVRLVGYALLSQELRAPKTAQVVDLWFVADPAPARRLDVRLVATGQRDGKPRVAVDDHITGDWSLPMDRWPAGQLVHDRYLLRLEFDPVGPVRFAMGLVDGGEAVAPETATEAGGPLVPLGEATYREGAPGVWELLDAR
jgi:poly-gamma-glutamate capsule biosynthesis protein CapA/YwtB (metallophosphatase superfamily)